MRPLIGITMNVEEQPSRELNILDQDYGRAVLQAGGMPVPVLGIAGAIPDIVKRRDGFLFTGRLSLAEHPWLAGHAVFGNVILPGTAFVELALVAAHRVGLEVIEEEALLPPLPRALSGPPEAPVEPSKVSGSVEPDGRVAGASPATCPYP